MIFIAAAAATAALVRLLAPRVSEFVAAKELAKPGMRYTRVGFAQTPIEGIWTPEEGPRVIEALSNRHMDAPILRYGVERVTAAKRGGHPTCGLCGALECEHR